MIEYNEAIKVLEKNIEQQKKTEEIHILDSYGYIVAEDIYSSISVPSFPKSAMDGYAVCSEDIINAEKDIPVKLKVAGKIIAGDSHVIQGKKGQAVRIMTGGRIPDGFDCVVKQEDTDYGRDTVNIFTSLTPYSNYCKIGEDIQEGQTTGCKKIYKNRKLTYWRISKYRNFSCKNNCSYESFCIMYWK